MNRAAVLMSVVLLCMGCSRRLIRPALAFSPSAIQGTRQGSVPRCRGPLASSLSRHRLSSSASSSTPSSSSPTSSGRVSSAVKDENLLQKTSDGSSQQPSAPQDRLDTNPPKGTRDFFPEDMRLRTWLFDHWRAVARSFGFSEYDAPVLESEALYTRKAGEEVTQQLYSFQDKGGRAVALRPEMTPSLARMVMARRGALPLPLKWFSTPQCWRYERMTRGRRREHFQWNMDVWGVPDERAEAELVAAMVALFRRLGLTSADVGVKVNSRLVIGEVLTALGIPPDKFAATCVLIDKLEKLPVDAVQADLAQLGLERAVVERLLEVLSNKSLEGLRAALGADSPAVQQLARFLDLCDGYGIADWIVLDASVVRGLAYYTGIVFESFDRRGELRAIAGGGRYDRLLETFGGDPTPAVGFGFGDAVIVELLRERKLLPSFEDSEVDAVVFAMSRDLYNEAVRAACLLRQAGRSVDVVLEDRKAKWVFKHADRLGAKYCIVVGQSEAENGEVSVKDLAAGTQSLVKVADLEAWARTHGD